MKKLYKVEEGKVVSGVCGGIAEYFAVDPSLVRVLTVVAMVFPGFGLGGLIAYVIAACILPKKSDLA